MMSRIGVNNIRAALRKIADYYLQYPDRDLAIDAAFVRVRGFTKELADEYEAFFIPEMDEWTGSEPKEIFNPEVGLCTNEGFCKFHGRIVFPLKNVDGDIISFLGWDPTIPNVKYMDLVCYGHSNNAWSLYGAQFLPQALKDEKSPVFFVEGSMCQMYAHSKGFHAFATLGSKFTAMQFALVNRLGQRAIYIIDSDEAGYKYKARMQEFCPNASFYSVVKGKDLDGCRRVSKELENKLLDEMRTIIDFPFANEVLIPV